MNYHPSILPIIAETLDKTCWRSSSFLIFYLNPDDVTIISLDFFSQLIVPLFKVLYVFNNSPVRIHNYLNETQT